MTECSSVGRAIDCSVKYCVSVFSEINWSLVRFRPLGFCLEAFGLRLASVSFYLCKVLFVIVGTRSYGVVSFAGFRP